MADDTKILVIKVRMDTGEVTSGVQKVTQEMSKVKTETKETGKKAQQSWAEMRQGGMSYLQTLRTVIKESIDMRGVVVTLVKALTSGFGITVVFGAIFGIVNAVRSLLVDLPARIRENAKEMEVMQLSLQALLATTTRFSDDVTENFRLAGEAAKTLRMELLRIDPQTLGGLKELQIATQALLATGSIQGVKNLRELAQVASRLANAVALTTGRISDQRQIFSEVKELMLGNVRAQNQIAQLIASQVGDLDAWLDRARKNKTLVKDIGDALQGIDQAAEDFGNTLEGLESSLKSQQMIIDDIGYTLARIDAKRRLTEYVGLLKGFQTELIAFNLLAGSTIGSLWDVVTMKVKTAILLWQATFGTMAMMHIPQMRGYIAMLSAAGQAIDDFEARMSFANETLEENAKLLERIAGSSEEMSARKMLAGLLPPKERATADIGILRDEFDEKYWKPLRERMAETVLIWSQSHGVMKTNLRKDIDAMQAQWKRYQDIFADMSAAIRGRAEKDLIEEAKRGWAKFARWYQGIHRDIARADYNMRRDANKLIDKIEERNLSRALRRMDLEQKGYTDATKSSRDHMRGMIGLEELHLQGLNKALSIEEKLGIARTRYLNDAYDKLNLINIPIELRAQMEADILKRLEAETAQLRIQLENEEAISKARSKLRLLRMATEGVFPMGFYAGSGLDMGGGGKGAALDEVRGTIAEQEGILTSQTWASTEAFEAQAAAVAGLKQEYYDLIEAMYTGQQQMSEIRNHIMDGTLSMKDMATFMEGVLMSLWSGLGQMISNAIVDMVNGTGEVLSNMKKFVGNLLIQFGTLAIQLGLMALAMSWIPIFGQIAGNPVAAGALIAIGAGMVALGAAMGGGGGGRKSSASGAGGGGQSEPTFAFNQALIDVNQGMAVAANALTGAATSMSGTMGRFSTVQPGVVVATGASQNGGVVTMAAKDSKRSTTVIAGRQLATNLLGGG